MKLWRWSLLIFELFLFALILVLPDVDLPDFAFQRGSAPIVAKARVSAPPVLAAVTHTPQSQLPRYNREVQSRNIKLSIRPTPDSLLPFLCMWLC
jgi:hypothetical protein